MLLQTTTDSVVAPLAYIAGGLAFGGVKYITKYGADFSQLRPRQLIKTLVVFGLAGGIVYMQGGDLNEANVVAATAIAAPIADAILNNLLPDSMGGSPSYGTSSPSEQ